MDETKGGPLSERFYTGWVDNNCDTGVAKSEGTILWSV